MKKNRWGGMILLTIMLVGCGKRQEESIPLVSDEIIETEENVTVPQVDSPLSELEFAIAEQNYQLPLKYEEAVAQGWLYQGDETQELEGESYITEQTFTVDELTVMADITNFEVDKQPVKDCYIGSISIDLSKVKKADEVEQVALAEQIVMLESTIVQAEDAYDTATDKYEGDDRLTLTYEFGLNKRTVLTFDANTEVLIGMELCNRQNPANEEDFKGLSSQPIEAVRKYQAPTELSADFFDYTVNYGGAIYQLPTPVSTFVDDGWELQVNKSDRAVKAGKYGYVTLHKDGQNLYAVVYNGSEESVLIKNCFVTTLYGDIAATKVPIGISQGIVLGMDAKSCLEALKEVTYTTEADEQQATITYYLAGDEEQRDYTAVTIDQALQMVSAIKVVHYPEGATFEGNEITEALEYLALLQKGD